MIVTAGIEDPDAALAASQISRRIVEIAGRMTTLLTHEGADRGPLGGVLAFLRSTTTACAERPPEGVHGPTPLERIAAGLRLTPTEIDLVILAGLAEEHEGFASTFRVLHPRGEPYPTEAFAAQLFARGPAERRALRRLLLGGAAARSGLVALDPTGPLAERNIVLADAVWLALQGIDAWPATLMPDDSAVCADGLEEWLALPWVARAGRMLATPTRAILLVTAERGGEHAFHRASVLAGNAKVPHVRLRLGPDPHGHLERLITLHAIARGVIPVVACEASREPSGPAGTTVALPAFEGCPMPVVVCARAGLTSPATNRPILGLTVDSLPPAGRGRLWSAALPELSSEAPRLAASYRLEPALVARVAGDVHQTATLEGRSPRLEDVGVSVRTRSAGAAAAGVRLVRPMAGWEQLVVRAERRRALRDVVDRLICQERVLDEWRFLEGRPGARGVRMLFTGPPGTGKTLAAEVLAHALGVDLLVVDIPRLVSKWVGETEKNLGEVFDTAERSTAVLFFDEADALFGRRTKVSDANDRFANLETAYLLTRLEQFEGLAILASNLRDNIDRAFFRRMEVVVDFEEPDVQEREVLWRSHVPAKAPLAPDVDFQTLASMYPLVGGYIRNAAVAAAFVAAAKDRAITQRDFTGAVEREYEKVGRAFPGHPR